MKTIQVKVKNIYGIEKIYPVCEAAHHFAALCGTKTFTTTDIQHIRALGYQLEQVFEPTALEKAILDMDGVGV